MPQLMIFLAVLAAQFILTVIAAKIIIPILRSKKMGQKILDIGPRWHKAKEGTPTMGGLTFIAASLPSVVLGIILNFAVFGEWEGVLPVLATYGFALVCGLIGFIDDRVKLMKKQNGGLSAKQKYLLQLIVAGAYLFALRALGVINTSLRIPFTELSIELGIVYYVFALVLLTGIVNSVNIMDGIDGLCSSVTAIIAGFFTLAFFVTGFFDTTALPVTLCAVCLGGCLGFLVYNFYPAKVFMGDTGSLFLGGLVVGLAFLCQNPLLILIAGFLYLVESASDIIQVTYFKLTHGKRVFLMAPIHHHFEKLGWSELKIVAVFSLVTLITCTISFFGL